MSDRFTGELWQGITEIYRAILAHPFLAGLTDGSLPHDVFAFYVVQDALYLQSYAAALTAVASRAPDTAGTEMFARHAVYLTDPVIVAPNQAAARGEEISVSAIASVGHVKIAKHRG